MMASQQEIEAMYDWVDAFHVLRLGAFADFTGAFFNGDYTKTLEEAQRDKHEHILHGIDFSRGHRILDIGCGWGPMLNAIQKKDGMAVGLTLSPAQNDYNLSQGLDSRLQDYKTAHPSQLGEFDGVVSLGAFEHFCSIKEFNEGEQGEIYENFFRFCSDVMPNGGKLYLQTMTWGDEVPDPNSFSLNASEGSREKILARTQAFYPGSWLPSGLDQIKTAAEPYFSFLSTNNGRLDYIETLQRWGDWSSVYTSSTKSLTAIKEVTKLIPRFFTDSNFRTQLSFLWHNDQTTLFKRKIFDHERMLFQKK